MTKMPDELLWTDRDGDQLYAKRTGPNGTRVLYVHPGEGEIYLPASVVDALRDALLEYQDQRAGEVE